jgi:hypothetical protein
LREKQEKIGVRLDEPDLPAAAEPVVEFFWFLNKRRGVGYSAPPPLTVEAVYLAQILRRQWLSPWEIDCLFAIDETFLAFARERLDPNYKETPPMIPGTADNIKNFFRQLARSPGKASRKRKET